jgi:hypothetical protein
MRRSSLSDGGYSQSGQLVHNSVKLISPSVSARIKAAVIFVSISFPVSKFNHAVNERAGRPIQRPGSTGITQIICHVGDNIYDHGVLTLAPHLCV